MASRAAYLTFSLCIFVQLGCGAAHKKSRSRPTDSDDYGTASLTTESETFGFHSFGWATLPVKLQLDKQFSSRQVAGIVAAANVWNDAVGDQILTFLPKRVVPVNKDLNDLLDDNVNSVVLERNWCKTGKSTNVLGTTVWNNDGDPRMIATADIELNFQFYGEDDANRAKPDRYREVVDIETLMVHEFGHMLGLTHIYSTFDQESIMEPSLYIGEGVTRRHLSKGDLARIRYLYAPGSPLPPSYDKSKKAEFPPIPVETEEPTPEPTPSFPTPQCN